MKKELAILDSRESQRAKIGKKLKTKREKLGKSRYQVAKGSTLSITQIKSIETGEKSYTVDSLIEYVAILDGIVMFSFLPY